MSKSKIEQTDANNGITLTPQSPTAVAAKQDNTLYLNGAGAFCLKKGGLEKVIANPDGSLTSTGGVLVSTTALGGVSTSGPVTSLHINGSAVASFVENPVDDSLTLTLTAGAGGGGGSSPTGVAGGDLMGEYPDPELAHMPGLLPDTYVLPSLVVDAKGRITSATSLGAVASLAADDTLVYDAAASAFVNKPAQYKRALFEGERVRGGWNDALYNTFSQLTDFSTSLTASGGGTAAYNAGAKSVAVGAGGVILTTTSLSCLPVFRIMSDISGSGFSVAISYSTDGSAWTPYTANSVVTLGSTPANFYIRFTFTGAGSFYGYSLFSSSSTPPATASSIMLDSSGFTGNLSTLTKNVQALAVVVDTLKTPSTPIFPATNRNLVKNKVHIYKSNSSDGSLDFILPSSGLVLGDFVDLHISTSNTATLRIIVSGGVGFTGPDNAFVSAYTIPKPITIGGVSATYHLHGVFAKCVFDGTYWLIASVSV